MGVHSVALHTPRVVRVFAAPLSLDEDPVLRRRYRAYLESRLGELHTYLQLNYGQRTPGKAWSCDTIPHHHNHSAGS